jgi:uncharacterized membrane protein YhaH (DUF805 family)
MKPLILIGRLIFGAWMLANGANYLFFSLWPTPTGHEPLAMQLMAALVHSRLYAVAMTIQLVTGALILTGFFVPVALCVVMPISTCALYWSLILDHQALGVGMGIAAFALNGLLMLAYLDYYRGVLQRHAVALTESAEGGRFFDFRYVNPNGRTARSQFAPALIVLLAVLAFYAFRVTGLTAHWCMLMLVYPTLILHARRLHDMGQSAWPLLLPGIVALAAFGVWLRLVSFGSELNTAVYVAALTIFASFALWGCAGRGQADANRFGPPVAV